MDKIEHLTEEQGLSLIAFRDECLRIGLATGPANLVAIRPVVNDFYARIGHAAPYLWRCGSPMMAQIIISLLRNDLGANLGKNLGDNLWYSLGENLGANLRDNLGDNLGDSLRNIKVEYIPTALWGSLDIYWIAFYLYPHLYLRPMHSGKDMEILNGWDTITRNAFWLYTFENICFVCDRPTAINKDEQGRLHNLTGPAVSFADGWSVWYVHGVSVTEAIVRREFTAHDIDAESNAEIRRVMIDLYTAERYLRETDAIMIHENQFGILWQKRVPDDVDIFMVEVINSTPEPDGSYKHYFLRVDPRAYNGDASYCAQAAVASTWRDENGRTIFSDWRDYQPAFES